MGWPAESTRTKRERVRAPNEVAVGNPPVSVIAAEACNCGEPEGGEASGDALRAGPRSGVAASALAAMGSWLEPKDAENALGACKELPDKVLPCGMGFRSGAGPKTPVTHVSQAPAGLLCGPKRRGEQLEATVCRGEKPAPSEHPPLGVRRRGVLTKRGDISARGERCGGGPPV